MTAAQRPNDVGMFARPVTRSSQMHIGQHHPYVTMVLMGAAIGRSSFN